MVLCLKVETTTRKRGTSIDRQEKYWSTKVGKRLRSQVEVCRFLQYLEEFNGNEDYAFDLLRGNPLYKVGRTNRIASMKKEQQVEMRKQSTVNKNKSNLLDDDIMTSNDASSRVDKKSAENFGENKRRKFTVEDPFNYKPSDFSGS